MKFTSIKSIKRVMAISFILWMGTITFAGNTIGDVPASANELRPIERQTTPYDGSCDIEQDLAFYDKSPVYLRVGQPKSTVNYVFDKTVTYVIVYNQPLFQGALKFPYVANFVPSTSFEPDSSNILTVEATGAIFSWWAMTMDRDEIAGQIITKNNERAALQNTAGATLNYYYKLANSTFTPKNGTVKINIHPQLTPKTSCTNYYVARCGDGVIDDEDTEGIEVDGDLVERHKRSLVPEEVCDDGELNGTPGHCKIDCTGTEGPSNWASCTLTANTTSASAGDTITLTASYASGTSATFTPNTISGFTTFTYPTWSGTATDTINNTTTYTLTVQGDTGTQPAVCSTTVAVEPHISCYFTFTPSPVISGQMVSVWRHITGGTFNDARLYGDTNVRVGGGRPYEIWVNDYNGSAMAQPNATGSYTFTLEGVGQTRWWSGMENFSCTWVLDVLPNVPPTCSLITSTPTINLWESAIINASYNYAALATLTPMITGLNFVYPNWIHTGIVVTPTETTTYSLNLLGYNGSGTTCSTTIHVKNNGLNIMKELITDILYSSGDLVTFKVNFSNNSSGTINNIILSDTLPLPLEYVSSSLFGVNPPYSFSTGMAGLYQRVVYSGFSLAPWQAGYMMIAGRVRWTYWNESTINRWFIEADGFMKHHGAGFRLNIPIINTPIIKTSNKSSYSLWEDAAFTIAVTNNNLTPINNITITDNRPDSSCVTLDTNYTSNVSLTPTSSIDPYQWQYPGALNPGQIIYIYLTWHISNNASCIGTYINNASVLYTANGSIQTGVANPLTFQVLWTPSSTVSFEKRLISYGVNPGDPVVFELLYQNNGTATITNLEIEDYRPGTLNFATATPMPTTQTPNIGWLLLRWIINTPLAPNGSGKITINGTIK